MSSGKKRIQVNNATYLQRPELPQAEVRLVGPEVHRSRSQLVVLRTGVNSHSVVACRFHLCATTVKAYG